MNIVNELKKKILVLDGAMGTAIQNYGLKEVDYCGKEFKNSSIPQKGNNDILNITNPIIIEEIHKKYLKAGADIIETNTFNGTSISQEDYGLSEHVYRINYEGAKIARKIADEYSTSEKPIFVAGSVGPTNKTLSISPKVEHPEYRDVSFDEMMNAYKDQMLALIDGGVDVILIETVFDTLNARAAIYALDLINEERSTKIPIMISGTITDKSGRTLSGQTLEAFVESMKNQYIISIGLNCAFGGKELVPFIEKLSELTSLYVSVYPNAGLPNTLGEYDESPDITLANIKPLIDNKKLNILGGCCGTTFEHIKVLSEYVKNKSPRQKPSLSLKTTFVGLEPVIISKENNFLNIGERTNVAGSKKFARLISEKKYEEALSIARDQVENGGQAIDINFDDGMLNSEEEMDIFLKLVGSEPDICKVPVVIDSSKFSVILSGLKAIQGKPLVNSISLKNGEKEFIEQAKIINRFNACTVVMAFDEKGQADTFERKIEICERAYNILVNEVNFPKENIVFDPNILAIATGMKEHDNYAVDFIKATRWIKDNLPGANISGGLSNLSFSFRGNNVIREAMHSVFLYHAIEAGMDMAILNPSMLQIYSDIDPELLEKVENVVLNTHDNASEELIEFAESYKKDSTKETSSNNLSWRNKSIDEKLNYGIVKGMSDYIEEDIEEALKVYTNPLDIIEKPLMDGMNIVGDLFGSGKMFLPQVVKSARVMKKSVEILSPYITKNKDSNSSYSGKIVMATVKGDVHDIGKNIVGVVLSCNNFEVIDLGIMVPSEDIISKVKEVNPDIIGLSGLITPSLDEMINVVKELNKEGITTPVMIGGATTSMVHTAVKIAPEYNGPVLYTTDASKAVEMAKNLCDSKKSNITISKVYNEYKKMRNAYLNKEEKYVTYEYALKNRFKINWNEISSELPITKIKRIDYSLRDFYDYIDWTYFFVQWGFKKSYPDILEDPDLGEEAKKLLNDANILLKSLDNDSCFKPHSLFGLFKANSVNDNIEIYDNDDNKIETLNMLRQQKQNNEDIYISLSDFIRPKSDGVKDFIGGFIATSGNRITELSNYYKEKNDLYNSMLITILGDRIAEAIASNLNNTLSKDYCSFRATQGIRPAYGYPSIPDHSEKLKLFKILNAEYYTDVKLTENYMMTPTGSVCGLYIPLSYAKYIDIGNIDSDQLKSYSLNKGLSLEETKKLLDDNIKRNK